MPESTRRQIGKYQIQAELGRGGFGVVYSAYDPTVGRPVAVKVLTALGDNQLLTRFKNEAAAAGNLRHKNIVTIYDYGDDKGVPYIVMELLEGEDLNQIIAAGKPMSLLQKVSIMVQVADGLRSAHRAGVVHRDVKPGNIRLLPDGTVKLMDFGIARLVAGSAATRLTRQGHVIGTLYYMAPEQVMGEDVDALSDIFAYGSTYYELLTGKHPFQGADPRSVFHKITAEDPEPIRNLIPDCPEALERIVNRTLQKDRDLRYQSLRDVQVDSEPILIELRQERAKSLVTEAGLLYSAGDLETAQSVLGEVFDLDPANRDARQLRETIQNKLLKRLIGPKIDSFLKKADDALSRKRYEDVVDSLEAAFRLDRTDQIVSGRLEQARQLLTLSRELARLVADARRNFSKQDLEGALDVLLQVLERDPTHPEAQRLFEEVRSAIDRRERERDFEEKLQKARQLLQANAFDNATRLLDTLDPGFRDREEVTALGTEIRSRKEAFERQQYVDAEIAAVRELLGTARFDAAIERVELLMNQFPKELEPTRLFILAHRQLASYRKAQALDKLDAELQRQLDGEHFERALGLVNQSLRTYPAEPRLLEAQRRIEGEWERHKRELAILQLLSDAEGYSVQSDLEKAVEVLEASVRQFPDEARLSTSLGVARDALAAKRREQSILAQISESEAQLQGRDYAAAVEGASRALTDYGHDDRLVALREKALAAKTREEAILALLERAQAQQHEGQYQPTLDALDRGLGELGQDRRLLALRDEISQAKAAWERAEAIREAVQQAQTAVTQQNFQGAIALLESALHRYGHDPQLADARASAQAAHAAKNRNDAIEALCREAQSLAANRNFARALQAIDEGLAMYGADEPLATAREKVLVAQAEWKRSETIRLASEAASRHLSHGDAEYALTAIDSALAEHANEPGLLQLRAVAEQALTAKRREAAIVALHKSAGEQLQAGAYADALRLLDQGLSEFNVDHRLAELRTKVEQAKAEWEHAEAIRQLAAEAHKLLARQAFEEAIALLEPGLERYGQDPHVTQALAGARAGLEARRLDEAIQRIAAQAQAQLREREYEEALSLVDRGQQEYGSDARLGTARDDILSAKAAWERAEAICQLAEEAQLESAQQQFEKAIVLLESALQRFGADTQLTEALSAARAGLERKRRDEAIDAECARAQAQTDKRDFSSALKTVDEGATQYGQDARFAAMRETILAAQTDWERTETIRHAAADTERDLTKGQPENALVLLDAAVAKYANEPKLLELRAVAEQALAAKRREAAIVALQRQAQAHLESGAFDEALELLARSLTEFDGDPRLADLRTAVELAKAERKRGEAIRRLAQDAQHLLAKKEFENAIALLESALNDYPSEPQLTQTLDLARTGLAARKRDEAIDAQLTEARAHAKRYQFQNALHLIDQALARLGNDPRLTSPREEILAAKANWERAEAIRLLTGETNKLVAQQRFDKAITLLESGVKRHGADPNLSEALAAARTALAAKRRDEAIDSVCKQAQAQTERRDFTRALKTLERGAAEHGHDGRLAAMRGEILAAQTDWERARFVRLAIEDSEKRLAQRKPELAVQSLEAALKRHPADPQLAEALTTARNALQALRREEAIRSLLAQAENHLQSREYAGALDLLDRGLKDHGADVGLSDLREKVLAAKAEAERAAALRRVLNDAHARIQAQQPESALELLESGRSQFQGELDLDDAFSAAREAIAAKQRVEALEAACRSAQALLDDGQYDRALEILDEAEKPEEKKENRLAALRDRVVKAKQEWGRSEAIREVLAESHKRVSENDLEGAMEVLNRALTIYPGAPELMNAFAEVRAVLQGAEKETAIAELSRETQLFLGKQDFPAALTTVDEGLKAYGAETRLADLRETVLAAQADWQEAKALQRAVEEADAMVVAGTPEKACRLLEETLSRYPGEATLLEAHGRALESANLKRREELIQKVCAEARGQLEHGKYNLALQQIEHVLTEHPDDRRLIELRASAQSAKVEAQRIANRIKSAVRSAEVLAERGEREEALALLEKTLAEHPGNPELVGAIVASIDTIGAAGTVAIDKICRDARQHMLTGNFDLAFHSIDQALRLCIDEQRTAVHEVPQKTRTEAAKAAIAGSGTALHRDTGGGASVKEETADHALGDIREQTDEIPVIHEPLEPPTVSFNPAEPKPRKPFKWWLIGGATALLLVVLFLIINSGRTPKLATLSIHAIPAGATIRVNDQICSTPNCEFHLKPGQYRIQVSAEGYRDRAQTASLRAGGAASVIEVSLEPLSPTGRLSTNFADGDVTLDNQPAGRIEDGQFTLDHLNPGAHSLQIASREGKASVSFDVDYAKLPVVRNISQQNTALMASASFGNRAVVTCTGCAGSVSIDDRAVGELTNGAITIDNVTAGTHRIKIGSERSLVFSASGAPGINLVVTSDRNYGAIIIETGEDNVAVYIDGNKSPHLTSHGQLLIPAEAKAHTIRIAKEGYRAEPPEIRAQLTKGDQFEARFKLVPEPAHLLVVHQLPGAGVIVDGSKIGAVGSNGTFSAQLSPGDHRIQFSKDGLTSPQVQRSFGPGRRVTLSQSDAPLAAKNVTPPPPVDNPQPAAPKPDPAEDMAKRQKELQQQAAAAREQAWAATDQNSKASLEQFLTRYGDGPHAQDARTMIGTLEAQELKAAQDAQKANEQADRGAADANAITNTIGRFQAAFNRRDLSGVQEIWTGMPKASAEIYRNEFRDAKSLEYHLTPVGQPRVNGDSASVICTRSQTFVAKNGQHPPPTSERVRVDLLRAGSQWVIRKIAPVNNE